jgi:deazaflavin-dependent oxidoreductase (nitroreductase family)
MNDFLYGDEHVRVYRETDGEEGFRWKRDSTILLLTTTGRKSGEPRTMPLIFDSDDDNYVLVASKGGHDQHPAWYLNLQANPEAEVQVKGDVFKVRARDAEGEERERLWRQMNEMWPDYDRYQERTERQIPVVVLERV